jgi:ABC-type Fe3+-hydroxamate transport system substrate-binding protein
VSLVPSITETLLSWGVRPVGVTRFCEAPGIPSVGGTKNPDIAAIASMHPDFVAMDAEENRLEDAAALQSVGLRVVATHVRSIDDLPAALGLLADAVGVEIPPPMAAAAVPGGPSVFVPIWRRPWMTIGAATYGSSLLAAAGFRNVCAAGPGAYPTVDLDEVASSGADFVLAPSEPYRFAERHRSELERVAPAVFVDGQDLFWWGGRTEAALRRLAGLAAELADR